MKYEFYENLIPYQGNTLRNINIQSIIEAVVEAGRNDDFNNLPIGLKEDSNRLGVDILSFDYNNDYGNETISVSTPYNTSEIKIGNNIGQVAKTAEKRIRNVFKQYGDTEIYIDMKYLNEYEMEHIDEELSYIEEDFEPEPIQDQPELSDNDQIETNNDPPEEVTMAEVINKRRTQLESDYEMNLNDIVKNLRQQGYIVVQKNKTSFSVTDKNLSAENSITFTAKKAYIERAVLDTDETKKIYEKMKAAVVSEMQMSLDKNKERFDLVENSPRLAGLPTQTLSSMLMSTISRDLSERDLDLADVFSGSRQKYTFKDQDEKEYISISISYTTEGKDNHGIESAVNPVIIAQYGKEYGNISKTFEVSKNDLELFDKGDGFAADITKKLEAFASIGDNRIRYNKFGPNFDEWSRESSFDDVCKEAFADIEPNLAKAYQAEIENYYRSDDSFYAYSDLGEMFQKKIFNQKYFSQATTKEEMEDLKNHKEIVMEAVSNIRMEVGDGYEISNDGFGLKDEDLSYTVEENGTLIYDSQYKEPFQCDREWLTKLGRLQDDLIELRNGPVHELLSTAKAIVKGINEARQGVVKVYHDGLYSGLELGSGISSLREGWDYGKILHQMESQYQSFVRSEHPGDEIAAINKKIDIKFYRDSIMRDANIYVKAAIVLRDKIDNMINLVDAAKVHAQIGERAGQGNFINRNFTKGIEERFAKISNNIVSSYKDICYSVSEISQKFTTIGANTFHLGNDALAIAQNKTAIVANDFKEKYNNVVSEAKITLSAKEYAKDRVAEKLNDSRIEQGFKGIESRDISKMMKGRFWKELDTLINNGHEAEKTETADRTSQEIEAISLGKQAKMQKEQNLFIAARLNTKITELLRNPEMTQERAVNELAEEYHKSAMAFNVLNGSTSVKAFDDLTQSEKDMCQEVIKNVLDEMPGVSEQLGHNLEAEELEEREQEDLETPDNNDR